MSKTAKISTPNSVVLSETLAVDPSKVVISKTFNLKSDDLFLVGDLQVLKKGLVGHHLDSMNELNKIGIPQIITQVFKIDRNMTELRPPVTEEEKNIDYVHLEIIFSDVNIGKPTVLNYSSNREETLFPIQAIRMEKTYHSTIRVNAHIKETIWMKNGTNVVREGHLVDFNLGKIPIMVGTELCHTYGLPKKVKTDLKEDPTDPGGYFIVNGGEWAIDSSESILFNKIRIFKNEGYQKEIIRAEFISRPGDFYLNSDEFIVRMSQDGQITIEICRDQFKGKPFPFYVIFRMLGWESDYDICQNITMNADESVRKNFYGILERGFNAKYAFMQNAQNIHLRQELLKYLAEELRSEFSRYSLDNEESTIKLHQIIFDKIDIYLLPHIGSSKTTRLRKLQYLSLMFSKIFLTYIGVLDPTDRDSYNSKRIHAAGTSYAKVIKTHLNASVIQQVVRAFIKNFKSQNAFTLDLETSLKASVHGIEFGKSITQAITAGNKSQTTINNKKRTNRLSSQLLNRKNQLNTYSVLRSVTTTSADNAKQSERANEIRRVHMSFHGYICCVHSPEGEKVGINKQLTIFGSITKASFGEVIKQIILNDSDCVPLEKTNIEDIKRNNMCNIFVNGDWIGVCPDSFKFAEKYRRKRRSLEISPEITIVWESIEDEVYFWTDVGRVIRPLIKVYNNKRDPEFFPPTDRFDPKKRNFRQGIALTQEHINLILARKLTMDDLLRQRVVEYISAEEQENLFICSSYKKLSQNFTNELLEFTHCDIEQAQLGLTALISPYSMHNAVVRTIFLTSQAKQTCSIYALNWPYRCDKEGFIQYQSEMPLVKTVSNRYLFTNGNMVIMAIMCYTGYNQEDSLIISKGSIARGLFNGSRLTFYKTKLEQREEFATPTNATEKIRVACYDKLVNGIVPVGTIVRKDDAIIGKIARVQNPDKGFTTVDRSIIYKDKEPAIVHDVIIDRNEQEERFVKVILRKPREVTIGDKFSSRSGQKAVCGILIDDADMPFTEDGMSPSFILNPHAIPSRMTLGQIDETFVSTYCAKIGAQVDGTIFRKVDMDAISNELQDMGMNVLGYMRLYSGITGEYIDCQVSMGPIQYQRLQKFIADTVYSVIQGPTDPTTGIPVEGGKANNGGLRLGEMETGVLVAHGAARVMKEKLYDHSDAYSQQICICGKEAIVNTKQNPPIIKCTTCGDNADIRTVPTSTSSKTLRHEIQGLGVNMKVYPEPYLFELNAEDV